MGLMQQQCPHLSKCGHRSWVNPEGAGRFRSRIYNLSFKSSRMACLALEVRA
jgi:hypothetical protein